MAGIPGLPTDPAVVRSLNVQSVSGFSQFGNQGSNPQYPESLHLQPEDQLHADSWTQHLQGRLRVSGHLHHDRRLQPDLRPGHLQRRLQLLVPPGKTNTLSSSDTGTKEAVVARRLPLRRTRYFPAQQLRQRSSESADELHLLSGRHPCELPSHR